MDSVTTQQLRNAVAVLSGDLEAIRAGRAIALSHEIATHLDAARELLARTAPRPQLVAVPGGAA